MINVGKGFRLVLPTEEVLDSDQFQVTKGVGDVGEREWRGMWMAIGDVQFRPMPSLRNYYDMHSIAPVQAERIFRRRVND